MNAAALLIYGMDQTMLPQADAPDPAHVRRPRHPARAHSHNAVDPLKNSRPHPHSGPPCGHRGAPRPAVGAACASRTLRGRERGTRGRPVRQSASSGRSVCTRTGARSPRRAGSAGRGRWARGGPGQGGGAGVRTLTLRTLRGEGSDGHLSCPGERYCVRRLHHVTSRYVSVVPSRGEC